MSESASKFDPEEAFKRLTITDKLRLIGGRDFWHFQGVNHAGVGKIRVSDGPNGVRGRHFFNGVPSSCFPSATGLGATFDTSLIHRIGQALGHECRAKSAHVHLAPTVNTQRGPLGGRGFESFSEDPVLNGMCGAAYVNGVQETGVASCPKHFVCNDEELMRFSSNSIVSERALREIYLEPFRLILKHSSPKCIMTAYNKLNGTHCSEHEWLLQKVLREEWGFEGLVMSDWTGVYSTVESIRAGLDVEMPGPTAMRDLMVLGRAMAGGRLEEKDIDPCVKRVLDLVKHATVSGIPFNGPEKPIDTPELRALLREAASACIVLLSNPRFLLPLAPAKKKKTIAVIGPNARIAVQSGGGSATVNSSYTVSPLAAIKEAAEKRGWEVVDALGPATYKFQPLLDGRISIERPKKGRFSGGFLEFWKESPTKEHFLAELDGELPEPSWSTVTKSTLMFMLDGVPLDITGNLPYIRYTTDFVPDVSGIWNFGLMSIGFSRLLIDGEPLINNVPPWWQPGDALFGAASTELREDSPPLEAGRSYRLEVRLHRDRRIANMGGVPGPGAIRLGALPVVPHDEALEEAVRKAKEAEVAVVVVGTNMEIESEGFDREHNDLPPGSDEMVEKVCEAQKDTIVIVQSGMPCTMPFVDKPAALLQAFFGGNEVGNGIADVLFGEVNPSGKLPLTFPKRLGDTPCYDSFSSRSAIPGEVIYGEGIMVGYRSYESRGVEPLFPFGHGLSYATFDYQDLKLGEVSSTGNFSVSFQVRNSGAVAGAEAAQIYVSDLECRLSRPKKELKAFRKVHLEPRKTATVGLELDKEALSYWDPETKAWRADPGEFEVLVGSSSADIRLRGRVQLREKIVWRGLGNAEARSETKKANL